MKMQFVMLMLSALREHNSQQCSFVMEEIWKDIQTKKRGSLKIKQQISSSKLLMVFEDFMRSMPCIETLRLLTYLFMMEYVKQLIWVLQNNFRRKKSQQQFQEPVLQWHLSYFVIKNMEWKLIFGQLEQFTINFCMVNIHLWA